MRFFSAALSHTFFFFLVWLFFLVLFFSFLIRLHRGHFWYWIDINRAPVLSSLSPVCVCPEILWLRAPGLSVSSPWPWSLRRIWLDPYSGEVRKSPRVQHFPSRNNLGFSDLFIGTDEVEALVKLSASCKPVPGRDKMQSSCSCQENLGRAVMGLLPAKIFKGGPGWHFVYCSSSSGGLVTFKALPVEKIACESWCFWFFSLPGRRPMLGLMLTHFSETVNMDQAGVWEEEKFFDW